MSRVVEISKHLFVLGYVFIASFLLLSMYKTITKQQEVVLSAQTTSAEAPVHAENLQDAVQQTRNSIHAPMLTVDQKLQAIAQMRADDMARSGYFAHESPTGATFISLLNEQNTSYGYACENLYMATSYDPALVARQWLASTSGHKECLLDARTHVVGYAVAELNDVFYIDGSTTGYIYVALFASYIK